MDGRPAVAVLEPTAEEHPQASDIAAACARHAVLPKRRPPLDAGRYTSGPFVQGDNARQGTRTIRPRACATDHGDTLEPLGRLCGPDHPATERVVLRYAVQRDQTA